MRYETITVAKSSPHIGAEIGNVDLTKPLSNREAEEIRFALNENGVVFFRNQKNSCDHIYLKHKKLKQESQKSKKLSSNICSKNY